MSETSEGPRELLITTEKGELGDLLVAVRDSGPGLRRVLSRTSLRPSTRPSRTAWGWGCRSPARSSKRVADDYGRAPMHPAARSFNSRCRSSRGDGRKASADRLMPPQAAGMSRYSAAEEITSICADFPVELRGCSTGTKICEKYQEIMDMWRILGYAGGVRERVPMADRSTPTPVILNSRMANTGSL